MGYLILKLGLVCAVVMEIEAGRLYSASAIMFIGVAYIFSMEPEW